MDFCREAYYNSRYKGVIPINEKKKRPERAILVGLCADSLDKNENSSETSLQELEALLQTAGGECRGTVLQNRKTPDPGTFIGTGKADEVKELAQAEDCELVIFDNELSPTQTRVLEQQMGVRLTPSALKTLSSFTKSRWGFLKMSVWIFRDFANQDKCTRYA